MIKWFYSITLYVCRPWRLILPMIRLQLYILIGRKYSMVGAYTYLSVNSEQVKPRLWSLKLMNKYPQLHILTNINIKNFPDYTEIIPLNTAQDILNAPKNTLVLIDEIGTIFNSRDFSGGKCAVPKPLFQHLCQCRKRRMQQCNVSTCLTNK